MADKPPIAPAPALASKPSKPKPAAVASAAPAPARTAAPLRKPSLQAPPPMKKPPLVHPQNGHQVLPLKPPPAHHYRQQQQQGGGAPRKRQYRHHRNSCSCRRVCCIATGLVLLACCLAFAAACLAYLYYHPRPPSFHLLPVSTTRFRVGNSTAVSAMDVTVGIKVVSWNPNDKIAFEYGDGEGRAALADSDGDVALGWAPVGGFEQASRSVAAIGFVAAAKGVVVDEAVAGRVRERYRRRQLAFKVVVDTHVGVRVGALRTGMVPVRLSCDSGIMAPRGGPAGTPMSKCQVYLFRMRWYLLEVNKLEEKIHDRFFIKGSTMERKEHMRGATKARRGQRQRQRRKSSPTPGEGRSCYAGASGEVEIDAIIITTPRWCSGKPIHQDIHQHQHHHHLHLQDPSRSPHSL